MNGPSSCAILLLKPPNDLYNAIPAPEPKLTTSIIPSEKMGGDRVSEFSLKISLAEFHIPETPPV